MADLRGRSRVLRFGCLVSEEGVVVLVVVDADVCVASLLFSVTIFVSGSMELAISVGFDFCASPSVRLTLAVWSPL